MRSLDIYCNDSKHSNDSIVRSCTIEAKDGERIISSKVLNFELPSSIQVPNDNDAEAYLIATILLAMAENRTLKVHGSVSRTLLSNLTEFRDAWNCWLPDVYHNIDFEATTIDDSVETKNNSAIAAFSGGLDSTFTVWRNTQKLAGYRSQDIKACVMVRGFDIFKENEYLNAFNQAQDTLNDVSIPLYPLRTNYRSIIELDWNHTHGTALASCLNNFKKLYSTGIIAGSYHYKLNYYPCGSNPITDLLLSSSTLKILHDGAKYTRGEKILAVSKWKIGVNNLRVCYSGERQDTNCGECGKCVQARAIFIVNGLEIPESMPELKNGQAIRKVFIPELNLEKGYKQDFKIAKINKIRVNFKWSYYYMIYKSKIIRGILKPKVVRTILKKIYNKWKD
ncbi:hypothetical protein ACFLZD_00775 [Candidatus Neomarinimicrobiota bacterium]